MPKCDMCTDGYYQPLVGERQKCTKCKGTGAIQEKATESKEEKKEEDLYPNPMDWCMFNGQRYRVQDLLYGSKFTPLALDLFMTSMREKYAAMDIGIFSPGDTITLTGTLEIDYTK